MSRGSVSAVGVPVEVDGVQVTGLTRTDAAVNPGNSGGPLVDEVGAAVGVVTIGGSGQGEAFAVGLPELTGAVTEWAALTTPVATDPCWGGAPPEGPASWVSSPSPDAPFIADTIRAYGAAISAGSYWAAWDLLSPAMQERSGSLDAFAAGLGTSRWLDVEVLDVQVVDALTDAARVTFRTEQAAEYGPDGLTCADWEVEYRLSLASGRWKIDGVETVADPVACAEWGD